MFVPPAKSRPQLMSTQLVSRNISWKLLIIGLQFGANDIIAKNKSALAEFSSVFMNSYLSVGALQVAHVFVVFLVCVCVCFTASTALCCTLLDKIFKFWPKKSHFLSASFVIDLCVSFFSV